MASGRRPPADAKGDGIPELLERPPLGTAAVPRRTADLGVPTLLELAQCRDVPRSPEPGRIGRLAVHAPSMRPVQFVGHCAVGRCILR